MIERLALKNIDATYLAEDQLLPVLADISISVSRGEFVSILGPSGSGKSTILKIAAGLLIPDRGQVMVDGVNVTGEKRLVGYMPQQDLLFPWKRLKENAALPLLAAGLPKRNALARVEELLPVFGLKDFADYYPRQLSGGMRQRASLLRTMLVESDILLLDEPFASLDALTRLNLQEWLLEIWEQFRRSVLFVTHSIDEAIFLSDRIYIITERPGRIAMEKSIAITRPRDKNVLTSADFAASKEDIIKALKQTEPFYR